MSIIAQLDQWIEIARQHNYEIRFDWFGGTGGGVCQLGNRKVLFIDLALPAIEQLELVRSSIENDPAASIRKAA